MVAISAILGAITALPQIVEGVDSVIGAFGGRPSNVVATGGPGFPGAGPVASTSVGPVGSLAGGGFVQAGFEAPAVAAIVPFARRAIPAITGVIGGVVGAIVGGDGDGRPVSRRQAILAQARANNPGATSKKIIRSAKECGIELAAATFGLNVLDVCFLLAQPASRRSRGISAADMRRTRSTIRKVSTIQKQLLGLSGPIRRRK